MRIAAVLALVLCSSAPSVAAEAARRGLGPEDAYAFVSVGALEVSPAGDALAYTIERADRETNSYGSKLYLTTEDGGAPREQSRKGADDRHPRFSPDGKRLAYLSDRGEAAQIRVGPVGSRRDKQITNLPNGVSSFEWSPDGRSFVFVHSDLPAPDAHDLAREPGPRTQEEDLDLAPIVIRRSQIQKDGEGFLGDRRSHLWVVSTAGGEAKRITSGPYDDLEPQFSPDGRWIAFVSNRAPDPDATDDSDLFLVRPDGSDLHRLAGNPGPDERPTWSHSGELVAFVGKLRPDDYYQASCVMVVPAAGGAPRNLTGSLDTWVASDDLLTGSDVLSRLEWGKEDATIFATLERHGANYLAQIPVAGGTSREILAGPRVLDLVRFSRAGDRIFFASSDPTHPHEISTAKSDGSGERRLTHRNDDLLGGVRLVTPVKLHAKNPDGDDVESWLYPPLGLDPTKKYPLILYIHGGPQGFDGDYFDTDLENQIFPANGWAVLRVNYRGSTSYGEKFCRSLWADWHHREYDDLMAAVDEALRLPWVDRDRLGIGGWSYGGIMTIWTVGHTDRFKVGVPERFEVDYLSCYGTDQWHTQYDTEFGKPWENADRYRSSSPGGTVTNIKTPLFLIANEKDGNCPPTQAMQFYQRLKLINLPTELVIYPGEPHSMTVPSHYVDRLHRLVGWFGRYLK
jgi:dipeptidyl aminopeptidase/acylaminoacyl peptidase